MEVLFASKFAFKIINKAEMYFLILTENLKHLNIQNLDLNLVL